MIYGAIEAGGTKFVCAVGDEKGNLFQKERFLTRTPKETIPEVVRFFKTYAPVSIGVGTFGPADVNQNSSTYGYITTTPKPGWKNYPLRETLLQELGVPIAFDTDVNAAALGEATFGAARGLDSCLYITVGTGIGAGALVRGDLLQGISHPEMGHVRVRRSDHDSFSGICPYHGDCLEGLASGPALEARWGEKGAALSQRKEVWELEAYYLAQALAQYILILSPKKIILGGGVMQQRQLFPLIRDRVKKELNGYLPFSELEKDIDDYIVPPRLGGDAGICGALLLGIRALNQ